MSTDDRIDADEVAVTERLRRAPEAAVSAGFDERMRLALRRERRRPQPVHGRVLRLVPVVLRVAAVLAIAGLSIHLFRDAAPAASDADVEIGRALAWLARTQDDSGSWDPAAWGGNARYRAGVTAVALKAFAEDADEARRMLYRPVVEAAAGYLLRTQWASGRWSAVDREQGLILLALRSVEAAYPDLDYAPALARAEEALPAGADAYALDAPTEAHRLAGGDVYVTACAALARTANGS